LSNSGSPTLSAFTNSSLAFIEIIAGIVVFFTYSNVFGALLLVAAIDNIFDVYALFHPGVKPWWYNLFNPFLEVVSLVVAMFGIIYAAFFTTYFNFWLFLVLLFIFLLDAMATMSEITPGSHSALFRSVEWFE
jgi:ABC-type multidrug transport system fused ATPase/permease subunit